MHDEDGNLLKDQSLMAYLGDDAPPPDTVNPSLDSFRPCVRSSTASLRPAAIIEPVLGVRPENLRAAMDEMTTRFGGIDEYFGAGLGIDGAGRAALRDAFLDVTPG